MLLNQSWGEIAWILGISVGCFIRRLFIKLVTELNCFPFCLSLHSSKPVGTNGSGFLASCPGINDIKWFQVGCVPICGSAWDRFKSNGF